MVCKALAGWFVRHWLDGLPPTGTKYAHFENKIVNGTALASGDFWLLNRLLRNIVNGDVNTDW
jgi:hypothetical protein